jgi:hypothetical protein
LKGFKENFTETQLVEYYKLFKELAIYHEECGFGDSPRTSAMFTEGVTRHLLGLKKDVGSKRLFDAFDPKTGKKYEIKTTTGKNTSSDINAKARPDYLIWNQLKLKEDLFIINTIEYHLIEPYIQGLSWFNKKDRGPFSLAKAFKNKSFTSDIYKINTMDMKIYKTNEVKNAA